MKVNNQGSLLSIMNPYNIPIIRGGAFIQGLVKCISHAAPHCTQRLLFCQAVLKVACICTRQIPEHILILFYLKKD